jgi:RNA polymerase sigma factor (sigma-70 family)
MDMKTRRFQHLVNQHKDLVYSQAYYFTGNKEDAEDITQEVLLKLWHYLDAVKGKAARTWLMKVTRHACIDHSRKHREQSFSEFEPETQRQILNRTRDCHHDPEQLMISDDLLQQGLKRLPGNLRHIVIMREIQDYPYHLIAESMDLPLNTVKVYLHRGRKLLAQYLNTHCDEKMLAE